MTRRETVDRLTARLVPLYGEREARAIARNAVAELAGLPLSALLTDPGAELAAEGLAEAEAQLIAGKPLQYVVGHTEFFFPDRCLLVKEIGYTYFSFKTLNY